MKTLRAHAPVAILSVAVIILCSSAQAQTLTVLHAFSGAANDGMYPTAPPVIDTYGNLYGGSLGGNFGRGAVYKISPNKAEQVLYSFRGFPDGDTPFISFVDAEGTLFGTTYLGGALNFGTVYKIDAQGNETILYNCCDVGAYPGAVIRGKNNDLYGITFVGGNFNCYPTGCGTMFKLDPQGVGTVVHEFGEVADGVFPNAGLVRDAAGNIYGTTSFGGLYGYGMIFKVGPGGQETILYNFRGGADGTAPSGISRDAKGNLYGTTALGGASNFGTVFKFTTAGQHIVLHSFSGLDGALPYSTVALDEQGNIYGSTYQGGLHNKGTVFTVDANGNEKVLHNFRGKADGKYPLGIIRDSSGTLYGTTYQGGTYNYGVVFQLTMNK